MTQLAQRRRLSDFFHRRGDAVGGSTPPAQRSKWWRRRGSADDRFQQALTRIGPTDVNRPTGPAGAGRRQVDALREQRANGNRIREWLQEQLSAAERLAKKRRKTQAKLRAAGKLPSRGTDRVPARFRDVERPVVHLVQHDLTLNPSTGRWVLGLPYRNPDRAERLAKSGRLRTDDQVGPAHAATPRPTPTRRKTGPHPWRERLHAAKNGQPSTPEQDQRAGHG